MAKSNLYPMTKYELAILERSSMHIILVWHPVSKRIVFHFSPFKNGITTIQWHDSMALIAKFLSNGWVEIERRSVNGYDISREIEDIFEVQRVRAEEVPPEDNEG